MVNLSNCPYCGGQPYWCGDDDGEPHDCHQISCGCGVQFDVTKGPVFEAETIEESRIEIAKIWNKFCI